MCNVHRAAVGLEAVQGAVSCGAFFVLIEVSIESGRRQRVTSGPAPRAERQGRAIVEVVCQALHPTEYVESQGCVLLSSGCVKPVSA